MRLQLSELLPVLGGETTQGNTWFDGVSIDTRTLKPDQMYVAIRGEHFDGHQFVIQAQQAGASALMLNRWENVSLPQLKVADTRLALGQLATFWRARIDTPLLAITGSNGKTTVKEMAYSILSQCGNTLATRGNLNNDIGVPLTLFRLQKKHAYAVIEMGANHPGEIAYLSDMSHPDVALINNAAAAHLQGFGDLEGVARAKGEIFQGLKKQGVAIINADDPNADLWCELAARYTIIRFGLENDAQVKGRWQETDDGSVIDAVTPWGPLQIPVPFPGRHNAMNALAAATAAMALGADKASVVPGLNKAQAAGGRLQYIDGPWDSKIINDSYNANPDSLLAGMQVLKQTNGTKWLLLGDMGELGPQAQSFHYQAGVQASRMGIDRLLGIGPLTEHAVKGFGDGAQHFDDHEQLLSYLLQELPACKATLLIKGSRSMHMENIVDGLQRVTQALAPEDQ